MRSPFIDISVPEVEILMGKDDEVLSFSPFLDPETLESKDEAGSADMHQRESATDDSSLKSLPIPVKNPVPFAPLPSPGSYWPIITSHSRGREVAFTKTDKTIVGMGGRRFLAHRTDGGRYHVGIDLWANDKDPVVACEDGTIVAFYHFYRSTYALLVEHNNLVINYGEVHKDSLTVSGLKIGDTVKAGQVIGMVGKMYSSSMLHFETYTKGTRSNKRFMVGGTAPKEVFNPTSYLLFLQKHGQQGTGGGSSSVPASVPSGSAGLPRAVLLNRKYSKNLGWDQRIMEINDLLLKVTGQSGMSLGEEAFAAAVVVFQRQQGLTGKNADGIIGPDTWRRMKPLLASANEYTMNESEMADEVEMTDEGEMWDILTGETESTSETDMADETETENENDGVYESFFEGEYSDEAESQDMESHEFYPDPAVAEAVADEFDAPEDAGEDVRSDENVIIDGLDKLTALDLEANTMETEMQYGYPEAEQFIDEEAYEEQTTEVTFSNEFDVVPAQGTTDYLNTGAVEKRTLKTGVFIPAGYTKGDKVDLIVYFHGLYQHGNKINGIEYYWKNYSNIRSSFIESRRNAILLAPTLTSDPQQSSIVFGKENGFDNFVSSCFKELKSRNYITAAAEPQRIILAGHSAGGSVLRRIIGGKNQLLSRVIECWGFDCLYNYNWEKLKFPVPFYHYWAFNGSGCISGPGVRGEKLQKTHGIQNIGPRQRAYHQGIIAYAWRNEINKRTWFSSLQSLLVPETGEGETPFPDETPFTDETPPVPIFSGSGLNFKTIRLPLSQTPITLVSKSDRNKLAQISEAPAVFLKRIVEMALGKDAAAKWFDNFTRITFLGRELQDKQYVHVELAKHLKTVERELAVKYGGIDADPKIAGDFLLGPVNERLAGSRAVSGTAKYSFHMFGLAIDVNYSRSPFIQNQERKGYSNVTRKAFIKPNGVKTMNEVLLHACQLANITPVAVFKYGLTYDQYAYLNKLLVSYLTLLDAANDQKLLKQLSETTSTYWQGTSIDDARKRIKSDLDKLALSVDRWGYRELFKKTGFLNISKEFVNGVKLDWGGSGYGDMMHFDLRNTGVGLNILRAIGKYRALKTAEAASKYRQASEVDV